MSLDDVVNVQITAQTKAPTRVGFGTPCVSAYHTVFPERARVYTDTDDMITDGFPSGHPAVAAVAGLLAQNPKPSRVIVGREENTEKAKINITPVSPLTAEFEYKANLNGKEAAYTTDATPTAAEWCTGMKAAIDALGENVTVTDNTTDIDIEADSVADNFLFYVDAETRRKLVTENVTPDGAPDGIVDDLTAIREANDEWYSLHIVTPSKAIITAVAAWIETKIKIFLPESADDDIYNGSISTDVASAIDTAGYARTACFYHYRALDQFAGCRWAGKCLPKDPGSITWKFKTLAGLDSMDINPTEETALKAKHCNYYMDIGGIAITQEGWSGSGEFLDITRGLDFIRARLQEYIFSRLANSDKISYTDTGVAVIVNEVLAVLNLGIRKEIFANTPEPSVTAPLVATVSDTDKANRLLPDIDWTAKLAGAIHKVQVRGTVTV